MINAENVAAIFAIVGGVFGTLKLLNLYVRSRPYNKILPIFSEPALIRDELMKLKGRTINFDTMLDFSVWNERTQRIASETEYRELLAGPASELNKKSLPIYEIRGNGQLDSFVRLVVSVRDAERLKFSHGGTGVIQVLLKGKFDVEVRAYSGPSVEFTLREVR